MYHDEKRGQREAAKDFKEHTKDECRNILRIVLLHLNYGDSNEGNYDYLKAYAEKMCELQGWKLRTRFVD